VPAFACDICAIYTATEMRETRTGFRLGLAEQYTNYATLQQSSEEVANTDDQYLRSSVTQLLAGYQLNPRVGLQVNLPIIARAFRRPHDDRIETGNETGFGDLSLLANVLAFHEVTQRSVFLVTLLGGLKLPSGDPDRLREELEEDHAHEGEEGQEMGPEVDSGVHGHDLALGSGSVDGIIGGQLFWSWRRLFLTAAGQYAIRTEGAFGYEYANDLTWLGGPGTFVLLGHDHSLALQGLVAGETKGKDTLDGETLDDTAVTTLFAGPALRFTYGTALGAELAADLPVVRHNTALQIVPDYRLRGAVVWRF
jgi:hypothetical protein